MASLYHSGSLSAAAAFACEDVRFETCDITFMACFSREASEQDSGIARRINLEAQAAPFDRVAFPGHDILNGRDLSPVAGRANLGVADRKPHVMSVRRQ